MLLCFFFYLIETRGVVYIETGLLQTIQNLLTSHASWSFMVSSECEQVLNIFIQLCWTELVLHDTASLHIVCATKPTKFMRKYCKVLAKIVTL